MWPGTIVQRLAPLLPDEYFAEPRVHLGNNFEIGVCAFEPEDSTAAQQIQSVGNGGAATAVWSPPEPTLAVDVDPTDQYAYEVLVFDDTRTRLLVAAVELVSPGNKDRPETRRDFVAKCATLLTQNVCVSIVDLVTTRRFNLYRELLEFLSLNDPKLGQPPPATYAATCRGRKTGGKPRFETWSYPLIVGQRLPTLPLWLTEDVAVSLDLENSYEDACKALKIP